jgi:hypothetical protein
MKLTCTCTTCSYEWNEYLTRSNADIAITQCPACEVGGIDRLIEIEELAARDERIDSRARESRMDATNYFNI